MRHSIICGLAVGALLFLAGSKSTNAADCQVLPAKVERGIKSFAAQVRGEEYCRYRTIAKGDLNGDGVDDIAVVFHVEGSCDDDKESPPGSCGNHAETYLAVFLGRAFRQVPLLQIEDPNEASVKRLRIAHGKLIANTLAHREGHRRPDDHRRPTVIFSLRGGVMVKETPQPIWR